MQGALVKKGLDLLKLRGTLKALDTNHHLYESRTGKVKIQGIISNPSFGWTMSAIDNPQPIS
jgi:hypothetical protein